MKNHENPAHHTIDSRPNRMYAGGRNVIPEEFHIAKVKGWPVYAYTVGELGNELKRLPADLPVEFTSGPGVRLVVYNVGEDDCHLEIEGV